MTSSCILSNNEVSVMNVSWNHPNDLYLDHYEISMKNAVYSARGNYMVIVPNGEKQVLTIKAVDICNQASVPTTYECKLSLLILHCIYSTGRTGHSYCNILI